jgi:hypothetical protein
VGGGDGRGAVTYIIYVWFFFGGVLKAKEMGERGGGLGGYIYNVFPNPLPFSQEA